MNYIIIIVPNIFSNGCPDKDFKDESINLPEYGNCLLLTSIFHTNYPGFRNFVSRILILLM